MFLTDHELQQTAGGDLDFLAGLDARGLILGIDETPSAFAMRLERFRVNLDELERELAANGHVNLEGLRLRADERIATEIFGEAAAETQRLYAFAADWVPGFYINPRFSWLFGGCAFTDFTDFFALFIIRKAFATQSHWLVYSRRELLAHELCHVARIALYGGRFEERFAYQTAETRFRRSFGCIFRTAADTFLLLASTLLLLLAQSLQVFWLTALPIWPFWLLLLAAVGYLGERHRRSGAEFARAQANLMDRVVASVNGEIIIADEDATDLWNLDPGAGSFALRFARETKTIGADHDA